MTGYAITGDWFNMKWMRVCIPVLLFITFAFQGCYKYAELATGKNPAYLRVFNSIALNADASSTRRALPFFTFLMDPESDADNVPLKAFTQCDFLTTRQLFSSSYPINEANSSEGTYVVDNYGQKVYSNSPLNFEYPGNAHVAAAPAINGFDLSAWAQIPSGRHRIVFVTRPKNDIPFGSLSKDIRNQIVIDTTLDFEKDEVYTLEIISTDQDKNTFGLYVRKEQFIHQPFEDNKIYVGYLNLSGKQPKFSELGFTNNFSDNIKINYSYKIHDDINRGTYTTLPGYDHTYYTTLNNKQDTAVSYITLPLLPSEYFFEKDTLRSYYRVDDLSTGYRPPSTMPFAEFYFSDANRPGQNGNSYTIQYSANPVPYNIYRYRALINQSGFETINYAPNLNLVVNAGNKYHIYPTLNIMEIVYDRVYMMQVQRAFNEVPN